MKHFSIPLSLLLSFMLLISACSDQAGEQNGTFKVSALPVSLVNVAKPENIVDLFVALPESRLDFSVEEKKSVLNTFGKTVKELMESGEDHSVSGDIWKLDTIDYKNAYLRFGTLGKGAGKDCELRYYDKTDGSKLLVVGASEWSMNCNITHLNAYNLIDGEWKDASAEVFPNIQIKDYMDESFDPSLVSPSYNEGPDLYFKLPREGKHIHALLDDCMQVKWAEEEKEMLDYVFEHWKYERIYLDWTDDKFVLGEKLVNSY